MGLVATLVLGACGPSGPAVTPTEPGIQEARPGAPGRTLVAAIRVEPASLAAKQFRSPGAALHTTRRLFNAELAILDTRGLPQPYLAEAVPQLHTDTWQLFSDGRMETIYRLRPDLLWQDGVALTADNFAFSWKVYSTPDLGTSRSPPISLMEEVFAADARTVVIRWRRPYADADRLVEDSFPPLPRHILQASFEQDSLDAFTSHPHWTRDYVGLGPFRLARWEPGTFIEASGFHLHALGRPKIERVKLLFISDANTALANILGGEIQLAADDSIGFQQSVSLKRAWEPMKVGMVIQHPNQWRSIRFQFRPGVVDPRALLDPRIRKALGHAVDRQSISDTVYEGEGFLANTAIPPTADYYPAIDRVIAKYPYEPRRSEQLMVEAGFARAAEGVYAHAAQGRLGPLEIKTTGSRTWEAEQGALAAGWRQAGFDIQEAIHASALAQDPQSRAIFPAMYTQNRSLGEEAMIAQTTEGIPRPENRWAGNNRGGWSNANFDRLTQAFTETLDRGERVRLIAEMARIYTEDLAGISLFFATQPLAHVAALNGPQLVAPRAVMGWDIHTWELR